MHLVKGDKLMRDSSLQEWYITADGTEMKKLTSGYQMFSNCSELKYFYDDLGSVTDGTEMFYNCSKLEHISTNLKSLKNGYCMFQGCTQLKYAFVASSVFGLNVQKGYLNLTSDLSSLTDGTSMFYLCSALTAFTSDLSSLTEGVRMFGGCSFTTFTSDLSSLTNGGMMFYNCYNLTAFTSDLSSLTSAGSMFDGCSALTAFTGDLSSLTNGGQMFGDCYNLTTFDCNLSSLAYGGYMFKNCTNLTSFNSDLSSLTEGSYMFHLCSLDAPSVKNIALTINKNTSNARFDIGVANNIQNDEQVKKDLGLIKHKGWKLWINGSNMATDYTLPKYAGCTTIDEIKVKDANYLTTDIVNGEWTEHLPDLQSAWGKAGMFDMNRKITTFIGDLSSLTSGSGMFYFCEKLTTFTSELSSLTNGSDMFYECSELINFNCNNLSSLTNGLNMFRNCRSLTTFTSNLSSLTNGSNMFQNCSLTTFTSNLSSLTDGSNMFQNCSLTTFTSNLSSLTDGISMFMSCKLDTDSVKNIAETIKTVTNKPIITIGIGNTTPNANETAALNTIANKGWTVYVNGSKYTPTSTASIMTLDELGNEVETPIPFYAKPVPSDEDHGDYIDSEGNYYNILGAQFIYGDDLSTYGMFTCEEDAAANMRLTKIEK